MRSFRSTLILALVATLVGLYTYYDYKKSEKEEAAKVEKEKILNFVPAEVVEIKIVKPSDTILLKRVEDRWNLIEPIQDQADNNEVTGYLNIIKEEKGEELTQTNSSSVNWQEYGLDLPGANITLKSKNSELTFQISNKASFDGRYFVRNENKLYLGTSGWARVAEKTSGQLRDKSVFRENFVVNKITLLNQGGKIGFVLTKKSETDSKWSVVGKESWVVDNSKVDQFLDEVKKMKATSFAESSQNDSKTDLAKYGLQNPKIKFELEGLSSAKSKIVWQLFLNDKGQDQVWGRSSSLSSIFKISSTDLSHINKNVDEFRDKNSPFKYSMDRVSEIEFEQEKKQIRLKKTKEEWDLITDLKGKKVNKDQVNKIIKRLAELQVKEFLEQKSEKLDSNVSQIKLLDSDQKVLIALQWGGSYKPSNKKEPTATLSSSKDTAQKMVYAKSSLSRDPFVVFESDLQDFSIEKLVQDK
ncbi:MAG: DUF4340 domain-containing protein [Bdellovibrionales bacterium]|nr:DUF4340 domain-containing protein [Bdellovibrionales bacterium]